ncbi:MAG: NAD(P)H-dependent oxidoreductase [Lewinellaceae bacterium]|nr:NAD(P)H-dependent oxidoreductase [Lewinellaceae bacterium]
MNILSMGASHSRHSINRRFANYVAQRISNGGHEVKLLDLNDYKVPIFTVDVESEYGYNDDMKAFLKEFEWADVIFISFAEHNGSYAASFKNLFDWASRINSKMFGNKPCIFLSTSTGGRGGISVLTQALTRMPFHGAQVLGSFSLPKFDENFTEDGILDIELNERLQEFIHDINQKLMG